jgi:hypothetical protein
MEFYLLRILALICSVALFIYTVYLVRIGRLSADLAVSWIVTEAVLIVLLGVRQLSLWIFQLIGEMNFYFVMLFLVIGWIITLMLDTLVRVSQVTNKARAIAQEHALLAEKTERLERIIEKLPRNVET